MPFAGFEALEAPPDEPLDARSYLATPGHDEAIARMLYLVEQRTGCGLLCGPTGTGKSLALRVAREQAQRARVPAALVDAGGRSAHELLWETAAALGLSPRSNDSPTALWQRLGDCLLANRHAESPLLIGFDHLDGAEFESLAAIERLYRTSQAGQAGVSLILVARETRALSCLSGLADLRIELAPLNRPQSADYVAARLAEAGCDPATFDDSAMDAVHSVTAGVPRQIERVCRLALLAAAGERSAIVTDETIESIARQFLVESAAPRAYPRQPLHARAG